MMYDELIKNLRHDSVSALQNCEFDFVHAWMLEAANAIEDLENRLNLWRQDKIRRWIPVTERLPEDGTEVLAFNKTGFAYVDCWTDGKWKINSMVDEEHESVTHWMPLPSTEGLNET